MCDGSLCIRKYGTCIDTHEWVRVNFSWNIGALQREIKRCGVVFSTCNFIHHGSFFSQNDYYYTYMNIMFKRFNGRSTYKLIT